MVYLNEAIQDFGPSRVCICVWLLHQPHFRLAPALHDHEILYQDSRLEPVSHVHEAVHDTVWCIFNTDNVALERTALCFDVVEAGRDRLLEIMNKRLIPSAQHIRVVTHCRDCVAKRGAGWWKNQLEIWHALMKRRQDPPPLKSNDPFPAFQNAN